MKLTSGLDSLTFLLSGISQLYDDALGQPAGAGDELDITTSNAVVTPGSTPGSGTVAPVDANGQPLLGLSYQNFEIVKTAGPGRTVVVDGTAADDHVSVDATGKVTVTNNLGFTNTVDVSSFSTLVIDTLGGNDTIDIAASGLFAGGIRVIGGEPGQGSDTLNINATAAGLAATVDFSTNQVNGVVGGPISITGIEDLNLNGLSGVLNTFSVLAFGALTDVANLFLNGSGIAGSTLAVTATPGPDSLGYTPTGAAQAH